MRHRAHVIVTALTAVLVYGLAAAAPFSRVRGPLSAEDQAAALKAAHALFGSSRHPNLELRESGKVSKGHYAEFAFPAAKVSDRMSTYTIISCRSKAQRWECALAYTQARFIANGTEHAIHLGPDMKTDTVLGIADFLYSSCFSTQLANLAKPNPSAPKRIISMHKYRNGFVAAVEGARSYEMERAEISNSDCNFKLVRVGTVKY